MPFDTREVHELAQVLGQAADGAAKDVRPVVQKGALNIKTDARRRASGLSHAPRYPQSITYDSHETRTGAWAEIGPDVEKEGLQGYLGNVLEFGTTNNAPHPHIMPAAEREEPRFIKALEDVAVEGLE